MTQREPEVKSVGPVLVVWERCVAWMNSNWRVGWWIALWGAANLLLNLLDLFA